MTPSINNYLSTRIYNTACKGPNQEDMAREKARFGGTKLEWRLFVEEFVKPKRPAAWGLKYGMKPDSSVNSNP